MEEKKKKQEWKDRDFEIEESNAMKVLRGKGEENRNEHESVVRGKKISKAENFWYTHKWHAGLIIAGVIFAVVILYQLIFRSAPDVYIMYTGPAAMTGNQYEKIEEAIKSAMSDYNGDGEKAISYSDITYLSEEQINARKAVGYRVDEYSNATAYQRFVTDFGAGEHAFCMLDTDLFDKMAALEAFVPLSEIFDEIPSSAYGDYGIRLGSTAFYINNPDLKYIPADTILAVRIPQVLTTKSDEEKEEFKETHARLLRDIAAYTPEVSE